MKNRISGSVQRSYTVCAICSPIKVEGIGQVITDGPCGMEVRWRLEQWEQRKYDHILALSLSACSVFSSRCWFSNATNLQKKRTHRQNAQVWQPASASFYNQPTLNSSRAQYCFQLWDCFSCRSSLTLANVPKVRDCFSLSAQQDWRWFFNKLHGDDSLLLIEFNNYVISQTLATNNA